MARAMQHQRVSHPSLESALPIDEVIRTYRGLVASSARRVLGNVDDVDDVVQETWIVYLRHGDAITDRGCTGAWLARVATNLAIKWSKNRSRAVPMELIELDQLAAAATCAVDDFALGLHHDEQVLALRAAAQALPAADRQLVQLLTHNGDLDYREISRRTGFAVGTLGPKRGRLLRTLRVDPGVRRVGDMTESARPVSRSAA